MKTLNQILLATLATASQKLGLTSGGSRPGHTLGHVRRIREFELHLAALARANYNSALQLVLFALLSFCWARGIRTVGRTPTVCAIPFLYAIHVPGILLQLLSHNFVCTASSFVEVLIDCRILDCLCCSDAIKLC